MNKRGFVEENILGYGTEQLSGELFRGPDQGSVKLRNAGISLPRHRSGNFRCVQRLFWSIS